MSFQSGGKSQGVNLHSQTSMSRTYLTPWFVCVLQVKQKGKERVLHFKPMTYRKIVDMLKDIIADTPESELDPHAKPYPGK